jgi:hypothetical protein
MLILQAGTPTARCAFTRFSMLKKIIIGLLAICAIVASIATRQGATYTVTRQRDIRAAPATVQPLLANPTQWQRWSPWSSKGPHMTVAKVAPGTVHLTMTFPKPVASNGQATLTLTPQGTGTRVTWRVQGPLSLRTRLITSFIGIDLLLGSELEKGLAGLKTAAEK